MDYVFYVNTSRGFVLLTDAIFRNCTLNVSGKNLPVNLVRIDMKHFDVILGINWLVKY